MKKRAYKLKDLSYLGLNLNYLTMIAIIVICTIIAAALSSSSGSWLWLICALFFGGGIALYIYQVGIRYGQYGLIISMAKLMQPKTIKNDFPLFAKNLIVKKEEKEDSL